MLSSIRRLSLTATFIVLAVFVLSATSVSSSIVNNFNLAGDRFKADIAPQNIAKNLDVIEIKTYMVLVRTKDVNGRIFAHLPEPFAPDTKVQEYVLTVVKGRFYALGNNRVIGISSYQSYYGYRWYDAGNGRWINRDPIKEDGGMNVHNFCNGDPINKVDVLGHVSLAEALKDGELSFNEASSLELTSEEASSILEENAEYFKERGWRIITEDIVRKDIVFETLTWDGWKDSIRDRQCYPFNDDDQFYNDFEAGFTVNQVVTRETARRQIKQARRLLVRGFGDKNLKKRIFIIKGIFQLAHDTYDIIIPGGLIQKGVKKITSIGTKTTTKAATKGTSKITIETTEIVASKSTHKPGESFVAHTDGNCGIMGELSKEGVLEFVIKKGPKTPRGQNMFQDMINAYGCKNIKIIRGNWTGGGDLAGNFNSFRNALKSGKTAKQAAFETFTGKMAKKFGYKDAKVIDNGNTIIVDFF